MEGLMIIAALAGLAGIFGAGFYGQPFAMQELEL